MRLRAESPEVWYADDALAFVGPDEIAFLKGQAAASSRLRARICLHANVDAPIHEMVIVHHRSCYVRPHRHPRKWESLSLVEGEATIPFFDDKGRLFEEQLLGPSGISIARIPVNVWHGLVIHSEWFVFHEIAPGPFSPDNMILAPWAPAEREVGVLR